MEETHVIIGQQHSIPFEVKRMFSRLNLDAVVSNLVREYGADRNAAGIVVDNILVGRNLWVGQEDYEDFLQAFFPILHEKDRDSKVGYKISELVEILNSQWYIGDMSNREFQQFLKDHPSTAYVRRSASNRSAFVIGYDHGKGKGPHMDVVQQKGHLIISRGKKFRSLAAFYSDWANGDWAKHSGVIGFRPIHSRKRVVMVKKFKSTTPEFSAKPVTGKMEETVEALTQSHYVDVGDKKDWTRWLG